MARTRQLFRNDSGSDLFIYLEPWTWRYRLRPNDTFELRFETDCAQEDWAPIEVNYFIEGEAALQIFVNGNGEPEMLINGVVAATDYL